MANNFWLYRWLDEFHVKSPDDVQKLLRRGTKSVERLQEIVAAETWQAPTPRAGSGPGIIAGRGIDLSGDLDCCHRVCQTRQVDALFSRVLHYFDDIVVAGPPAHRYSAQLEDPDEQTLHNLQEHSAALLYLRELGVEDMLVFIQKVPACEEHFRVHADEAGLSELLNQGNDWVDRLTNGGTVDHLDQHDDHWHYMFTHPDLEHSVWGAVVGQDITSEPTIRSVAEAVFARYSAHLVSDVVSARSVKLPLGTSVQMHGDVLSRPGPPATVEEVAFDMRLPVLEELPIRDIVRLREEELEYFHKFRQSLSDAIAERLKTDPESPTVAEDVKREVIDPALIDIAARLRAAERALNKKVGTAVAMGSLLTSVGLLTAAPLVVGAGVVAYGSSLPAAQRYFDDKGVIELSDMYFLWHLEMAAAARHDH